MDWLLHICNSPPSLFTGAAWLHFRCCSGLVYAFVFRSFSEIFSMALLSRTSSSSSAPARRVSRKGAQEGGREQEAVEGQSKGRLEGAVLSFPHRPCQHPCWKHHFHHQLVVQFPPVLTKTSFFLGRRRLSLPDSQCEMSGRCKVCLDSPIEIMT